MLYLNFLKKWFPDNENDIFLKLNKKYCTVLKIHIGLFMVESCSDFFFIILNFLPFDFCRTGIFNGFFFKAKHQLVKGPTTPTGQETI